MRLRTISLLSLSALAFIFLVGQLLLSRAAVEGGFHKLEDRRVRDSVAGAEKGIRSQLAALDVFLWDWSSWDDTYQFAQDQNPEYIQSNLPSDTFVDQSIAAIVVWDRFGKVIYSRAVDKGGQDDPASLGLVLDQCSGLMPDIPEKGGSGGFISLGPTRWGLAAKRPILTSDNRGPSMGTMLMIRPISLQMIENLSELLGFPVLLEPLEVDPDLVGRIRSEGGRSVVLVSKTRADGVALFGGVDGQPLALLRVAVSRGISIQGERVMIYNSLLIALVILTFSALLYLLLHKKVLARLETLSRQVKAIGEAHFEQGRVSIGGSDEISLLAGTVNSMLDSIAESHRETMRKSAEVAENERFLNQLFNSISVGVFLVDAENKTILEINDRALSMVGRTRNEIVGKACHKLVCPSMNGECPILDHHKPGDMTKRKMMHKGGYVIPVMKSVLPIERSGKPLLLETVVDISDMEMARAELESIKNELEDKVAKRTVDLEVANRELVALDKAKTLFLSSASHELRTPLTSVIGFLKLMERSFRDHFLPHVRKVEGLSARADVFVGNLMVVRSEADRLGRLVNDLLDLNRIESGRMEWRDELLRPEVMVERAGGTIAGQVSENPELDLLIEVEPDLPEVLADSDRLHQVLINLLNNAVKFTDKGHVSLEACGAPGAVEFVVSDTGRGIPEENQPKIFELFYQAQDENMRSSKTFGTGLGLAICRQIVAHYGGTVSFTSTPGQGSRFVVSLPTTKS